MENHKDCLLFSLLALVGSLLVGCGDDAVEKLEQRVDELEDELEQVKRDQSSSRGHQQSWSWLFGVSPDVLNVEDDNWERTRDVGKIPTTTNSGSISEEGVTE